MSCGDEPMAWRIKHDRDAFKELWLLFENDDVRFPLYSGETTWIKYIYTVSVDKWGREGGDSPVGPSLSL